MLGLLYHHATLLALILIVTFSAHIFTNAILKNMMKMNKVIYKVKEERLMNAVLLEIYGMSADRKHFIRQERRLFFNSKKCQKDEENQ